MKMPEKEFNARRKEDPPRLSWLPPPKRREGTIGALKREKKPREKKI